MFINANSPRQFWKQKEAGPRAAWARIDTSHMVAVFRLTADSWIISHRDSVWGLYTCFSLSPSPENRATGAFDLVKWGDPVSCCVNVMSSFPSVLSRSLTVAELVALTPSEASSASHTCTISYLYTRLQQNRTGRWNIWHFCNTSRELLVHLRH